MSQADEGLIHAWLDGQLSPDEAMRVERMVATDVEWGAAAAEARGMIAGASRILGALDDVPAVRTARDGKSAATNAGRAARTWRRSRWLGMAAGLVLVAGIARVAWQRLPTDAPVGTGVGTSTRPDITVAPVIAKPPAAAQSQVRSPSASLSPRPEKQRAPSSAAAGEEKSTKDAVAGARSDGRNEPGRIASAGAGAIGVAAAGRGAATNAAAAPRPVPLVEQGLMGGARQANADDPGVDPRLSGCWVPLDSARRAGDLANQLAKRDVFVLRFIAPVVTDVVRPGILRAAERSGGRGGAGPPSALRAAPAEAQVQNVFLHAVNDSTFVTEWRRADATVQLTFTVHGDTLRGTVAQDEKSARLPPQPFSAVRVACPR